MNEEIVLQIDPTNIQQSYEQLMNKYDKSTVMFIFYDLYKYKTDDTKEIIKRGKQNKFRQCLINKYNSCIITNVDANECEACHIKPFNECNESEKYDVNNGLLLSANLHKLFDEYIFSIDPETLQIKVINNDKNYSINKYVDHSVKVNKNSKKYLEYHYEMFKKIHNN